MCASRRATHAISSARAPIGLAPQVPYKLVAPYRVPSGSGARSVGARHARLARALSKEGPSRTNVGQSAEGVERPSWPLRPPRGRAQQIGGASASAGGSVASAVPLWPQSLCNLLLRLGCSDDPSGAARARPREPRVGAPTGARLTNSGWSGDEPKASAQ